ncbi:MAG: patatin-like phospholipase family protein [Pseudomonadales bacterium]
MEGLLCKLQRVTLCESLYRPSTALMLTKAMADSYLDYVPKRDRKALGIIVSRYPEQVAKRLRIPHNEQFLPVLKERLRRASTASDDSRADSEADGSESVTHSIALPLPGFTLRPPTVIALAGGGAKGSFEAGVLAYFKTIWQELNVVALCGTSVGAVNAIAVAAQGPDGIDLLTKTYLNLADESDVYVRTPAIEKIEKILEPWGLSVDEILAGELDDIKYQQLLPDTSEIVEKALKYAGIGILGGVFTSIVGGFWGGKKSLDDQIAQAKEKLTKDLTEVKKIASEMLSFYSLTPLKEKILDQLDLNNVTFKYKLRMSALDLNTGEERLINEEGDLMRWLPHTEVISHWGRLQGSSEERLVKGVLASAAFPGLFEPQLLRDNHGEPISWFVDGGVFGSLPMRAALSIDLATRIFGVLASPDEPGNAKYSSSPQNIPTGQRRLNAGEVVKRSANLSSYHSSLSNHKPVSGWPASKEPIMFEPHLLVHGTKQVDPGRILINVEYGYMEAFSRYAEMTRRLRNPEVQIPVFQKFTAREITRLRLVAWAIEETFIAPRIFGAIQHPMNDLRRLRTIKREILDLTLARFHHFGPESLPVNMHGRDGRNVHDWWESWERHRPSFLDNDSIWTSLSPLDNANEVGARPHTDLF